MTNLLSRTSSRPTDVVIVFVSVGQFVEPGTPVGKWPLQQVHFGISTDVFFGLDFVLVGEGSSDSEMLKVA